MKVLWLAVLLTLSAAPAARAETQTFMVYDFEFENGTALPELRIAYETYGELNPGRENAILLIDGTSGDRSAFDGIVGPGKAFDTDKYFVVVVQPIGGGGSSSPKDGLGQDFPRYTIRDMMAAQHAFVTRCLELTTLRAVVGSSIGAFVGIEWGIHHSELVRSLILLGPTPKADANYKIVVDLVTSIVALDPEWQGGRYVRNPVEGLRLAGMLYYPWTVTSAYLDRISAKRLAKQTEESARLFSDWDANSLVLRYAAARAHDVSVPFGSNMAAALAQIAAPTLILASESDRLMGLDGARRLRDGIRQASYAEIPSELGDRALSASPGTPERDLIDERVKKFLAKIE